jgi:hypothetical protein
LATTPHRQGRERRPLVPPIVVPISARGIPLTDRVCTWVLGVAMAASVALILYLNRGSTFYFDELRWFTDTANVGAGDLFDPHNGHLIAVTRLAYKVILETLGAEYVAFRLLAVPTVPLCAGLFYAYARRRIGALPALAPALVLLFLGSASQHVLVPIGFTPLLAIAFGLGALLCLDRRDRRGDLAACLLLVLSVLTYTTGLAFVVGVAVSVLIGPDRRRVWIFAAPVLLYAVWQLSSGVSSAGETQPSNLLLVPAFVADSLATASAAVLGLGYDFTDPETLQIEWGRIAAGAIVVAVALTIRRGAVPASLWSSLAIVVGFWSLAALAADEIGREPGSVRYVYMGSLGVLLVSVDAAASLRFSRRGLAVLFAACAVSLCTNIALMRDRAATIRDLSSTVRAELAAIDIAGDPVGPGPMLRHVASSQSLQKFTVGEYLNAVSRYGSPAFTVGELMRRPTELREDADKTLARSLGITVESSAPPPTDAGCGTVSADGPVSGFELPAGETTFRVGGAAAAPVTLGRFGDSATVEAGRAPAGQWVRVTVPHDAVPTPWRATIGAPGPVRVCSPR